MAKFDDTRNAYNAARAEANSKRTELTRALQLAKRLQREAEWLARRANAAQDNPAGARFKKIKQEQTVAENNVDALKRRSKELNAKTLEALNRFAEFTNPIQSAAQLTDDEPVALFPLRLETRFKTVTQNNVSQQLLCVRVFPDDVLIDTFQPEISQTELRNVTIYWTNRWRAGRTASGHRAAWAALVRSHGAGRAKWLTDQVKPLNPGEEPVAQAGDYILVIRPATPVPSNEKLPISTFWARVWSSAGAQRNPAFADLRTALGANRATEVEKTLEPVNLRDTVVTPGPSIRPVVVFLDLPDPATLPLSQDSWTRPARASLLPERLVLLGFRGGQQVLQQVGQLIPPDLQIGPDPAEPDDQINAAGADLKVPEALRWTVDFKEAVAKGMGFEINLTQLQLQPVFDRLFVLGLRIGSDAARGASELSELIAHHQGSRKGFTILPQGRATNNTDVSSAGYTWFENPDDSFKHFFETDQTEEANWERRKDGAWLAGMLGLDRALLRASVNYYGTDQSEARAMNTALWPATLGYYMEQLLEPVFADQTVIDTREFFNRFVIGRGVIPLVRIGRQPYGILPATVWSRMKWWTKTPYQSTAASLGLPTASYLTRLHTLSEKAVVMWKQLAEQVVDVGDAGTDPHQTLLDIVGLHPTSVEFYQRYSQSFTQHYNVLGFATTQATASTAARNYVAAALAALRDFGWIPPQGAELPELLEKIFLKRPNLLTGELVQAELSDTDPLSATRADGLNYIAWLQSAARISHDTLRKQEGFAGGIPTALLYLLLHHALDLGFVEAGLRFRREALGMTDDVFKAERREPKFIQVEDQEGRSRWESLYRAEPLVTNDPALRLGDYISRVLLTRRPYLNSQVAALDVLKVATSGALERAFVEHLDCLTYRMDAWRLGLQAVQLSHMRGETRQGFTKTGIYVGAYGWLENVQAAPRPLQPVQLDPELTQIFKSNGAPPLMRDPSNFGHIHAPSLDHAVTASILRNGHLTGATPEAPDLLAVDLTSERVRLAQQVLDGIRSGQSLGALLGYRLERSLHDESALFLDRLIYALRRAFPLAGNRNLQTKVDDLSEITQVEARNVLDGLAFIDHLAATKVFTYPYGLTDLPPLSELTGPGLPGEAQIGAIIDKHVTQMRSVGDAVADLEIAEGVYQVVRGNYDRAAGMLDALSKGTQPPVPEIITTPRNGNTITHRITLHLEGGLPPTHPPNRTPRSKGEPALAQWLARHMPDPGKVFARVTWRSNPTDPGGSLTPSMTDLGLDAVDLFYLVDAGGARSMAGFDDLMIDFAERKKGANAPRHDAVFTFEYKPQVANGITLFELAPLVRALRGFVLGARPLRATDLSLQNEAASSEDAGLIVRTDKVQAVVQELQGTLPAINTFIAKLEAAIGPAVAIENARNAARDNLDQWVDDYAAMIRPVFLFGLQAASLTRAIEGRRGRLISIREAISAVVSRWEQKGTEFNEVMASYAALPATATNEERTALLIRAGRIVSTTVIAPLPATIAQLESQIASLRSAFDTRFANLKALRDGATRLGQTLVSLMNFVPAMQAIDQTPFDVNQFRDSVLALARDLSQQGVFLRDDINRRLATANDALARAAVATRNNGQSFATEAVHALLGDAFLLLSEFKLSEDRLAEFDNVWSNRAALLAHLKAGTEATPFPVDDWLHGVARVRERSRNLELATLLGEALGVADPLAIEALQFPFRPNDAWVGLRFPQTTPPFVLAEDKLLYSAHFGFQADIKTNQPDKTYCGLLLDEWTEVIPTDQATTGLTFHFNRPNSEPPQTILLVTPPDPDGTWNWQDIVDALHETLDFARLRAVEPAQLDQTFLGPLLPAVISAVTMFPITSMLNLGFNNNVHLALE